MTIRPIRQVGDPVLRTPTEDVRVFDDVLHQLVADMFETMYDAPGVGLAANQIGVGLRLFVYDCGPADGPDGEPGDGPRRKGVVCNSHIADLGGRPPAEAGNPDWTDDEEGCLSVRGLQFETPRWSTTTCVGVDEHGEPITIHGEGLLARCLQHETDHLDGKLYLDRLVGEAKAAARKALSPL
ncbi:MAG TPA: peptide deformylase [Mycobacteriales bacterium]